MIARGGLQRCAHCGCEAAHHRRNVYGTAGAIVRRVLGKCWFAGCKAGLTDGRTNCPGWKPKLPA